MRIALGAAVAFTILMFALSPPNTLDARFYYSGEEARAFFEWLSPAEAAQYFYYEFLDLIYIAVYTWALASVLRKSAFAFFPAIFDVIETVGILLALKGIPVTEYLGLFTAGKWLAAGAALIVFLGGKFRH